MITTYFEGQIKRNFSYKPTLEQEKAIKILSEVCFSPKKDCLMLLKGYAGTGKTSIIAALVKTFDQMEMNCVLLAPTGRAAKVFAAYANHQAFTIHKKIYRQKDFDGVMGSFSLDRNLHRDTLFIVDEASMISNQGLSGSAFGSGMLLDDLMQYVYEGDNCRLVMVGDMAQLPPVGEEESPALSASYLEQYGVHVYQQELTEVVRQKLDSGILWNATNIRRSIADEDVFSLPTIKIQSFDDVKVVPGDELIDQLSQSYYKAGMDDTIVVCRSNKRANFYNNGIRNTILDRDAELCSGDRLMVAKNNYFWAEKEKIKQLDFIANGDIAIVRRVRNHQEIYGFRFADVTLSFVDYDDVEFQVKVILDTLHTETPSLTRDQSEQLFQGVWEDYAEIRQKRERMKKIKEDPYYNALQIKYAYAVTCHKAQGGQWNHVYIDQGYITADAASPDYYRWLYTALTRSREQLYLVNWPKNQIDDTD